jgi:hypothetical protein
MRINMNHELLRLSQENEQRKKFRETEAKISKVLTYATQ